MNNFDAVGMDAGIVVNGGASCDVYVEFCPLRAHTVADCSRRWGIWGFTKFTQLHVVTSSSLMCALRAQITVELEPGLQHISLASHTSLQKVWLVALAPQACQGRV